MARGCGSNMRGVGVTSVKRTHMGNCIVLLKILFHNIIYHKYDIYIYISTVNTI